uniref:Uncharacterized protein n=1 Tax=Anguilla anguilla TaxID=7936 RepID=A0A0E9W256_ANGAN
MTILHHKFSRYYITCNIVCLHAFGV